MRTAFVLTVALALPACQRQRPPVAAAPEASEPTARVVRTPAVPLSLPALEATNEIAVAVDMPDGVAPERWQGKMVVDGVVTEAMWPEQAPAVYRLGDGRFVLYDGYNENRVWIWEPGERRLTDLGRLGMVAVPRRGWLFVRGDDDGSVTYFDVDPARPGLREVWRDDGDGQRLTQLVGERDGAPVLLRRSYSYAAGGGAAVFASRATLVIIRGVGEVDEQVVELPAGLAPANGDAVRGDRLLLTGARIDVLPAAANGNAAGLDWMRPFEVEVRVLDLATGELRDLGTAPGAWTQWTAIPHPYIGLVWSDHAPAVRPAFGWWEQCMSTVDVRTESIRAGCYLERPR